MPDLDLIKQGKQGPRRRARAVRSPNRRTPLAARAAGATGLTTARLLLTDKGEAVINKPIAFGPHSRSNYRERPVPGRLGETAT